jgi:GWxTD domain-containing protein
MLIVSGILAASFASCRLYNLERKLDPVNAEFLSKVRYIITREENKIFLELPASEKEKFKEEFWKRRDPDPETEENEFKIEYENRIERATEMFLGEGKPGWLTDRGRIYVLFGPPTDRITNPMGYDAYDRCSEIWYYGGFPVVFRDSTCTGNFQLVTYDLTALRELNLAYMHELSLAQAEAQKTFSKEKSLFDFSWDVKKTLVQEDKVQGTVVIQVPYGAVWFKARAGELETALDVHLELFDFEKKLVWEHREAFTLKIDEETLKKKGSEKYLIEIPFVLEKDLDRLRLEKGSFQALIKNTTGGEELKKAIDFKL